MAPRYNPPTRVVTRQTPQLALVTAADPLWNQRKHREIEYYFDHRVFRADPYNRGAYNNNSNVYPIGQQFGGTDPLVVNNKAPTVGNATPGLYQGVPDGKGWA